MQADWTRDWYRSLPGRFDEQRVESADGTDLRVVVRRGATAPVILLHGVPQHGYAWRKVIERLPDDLTIYVPDMRGCGASGLGARDAYDIDRLSEDVGAVVDLATRDAVGEDTASDNDKRDGTASDNDKRDGTASDNDKRDETAPLLVAHDWGGPPAYEFVTKHPGKVRHLLATNAPNLSAYATELYDPRALCHGRQLLKGWYTSVIQWPGVRTWVARSQGAFARWLIEWLSPKGLFTEAELEEYVAPLRFEARGDAIVHYYRDASRIVGERKDDLLHRPPIDTPVTVVWADADGALSSTHPETLRRFVTHLDVYRIPGGSHWVPEEHPEEIVRVIKKLA